MPLTTFLSFLFDVVLLLFRNQSNKKHVFFATIIKTIIEIGLSIYFIMYLNMAGIGRILAFCLCTLFLSFWSVYILIKKFKISFNLNLKFLKEEFGFKTFHPIIDESYDEEENPQKRMQLIRDEIKRLNSYTLEELKNIISIDETSINVGLHKIRGREIIGKRLNKITTDNKVFMKYTLIMAISPRKIVRWKLYKIGGVVIFKVDGGNDPKLSDVLK